jgi:hypothetical protein
VSGNQHAYPPETRPLNDLRASAIAIGAGLHAADAAADDVYV